MSELMGRNEYARHRKCAPNAVSKAIKSGRIRAAAVYEGGKFKGIRWEEADALWAQNTDPVEAARNGKYYEPPPVAARASAGPVAHEKTTPAPGELNLQPAAGSGETAPRDPAGDGNAPATNTEADSYLQSRARKEHFAAQQAELEYLKAIGQLVSAADIEREMSEVLNLVKSNVFRISDRKAQILSAEADPTRVHKILNEEFRTVFDECSRRFAVDAPEGAEECAGAGT